MGALLCGALFLLSWAGVVGSAGEEPPPPSPRVGLHGWPEFVAEHGELPLPGAYLKTVFLQLAEPETIVAVPVHDGEPADNIAADVFRRYGLAFDEQYIDIHNMIAAVQAGQDEGGIPDITRSKVDPRVAAAAREHPVLGALDLNAQILVDVAVKLRRPSASAGETSLHRFTVRVLEGDLPAAAVKRWEEAVGVKDGGHGWRRYGGALTEAERALVLDEVAERVADVLMREDAIAAQLHGWAVGRAGTGKGVDGSGALAGGRGVLAPDRPDRESSKGTLLTEPLPPMTRSWGQGSEEAGEGEWRVDESDAAAAQELIYRMQYPEDCQGRRAVVMSMDGAVWGLAVSRRVGGREGGRENGQGGAIWGLVVSR